nr:DUF6226 family protein [Agrococcus sp. ARC_14]
MPTIPVRQWLDAEGRPIAYGQRWSMSGPPASAYSGTSNTERYAPLHAIAVVFGSDAWVPRQR